MRAFLLFLVLLTPFAHAGEDADHSSIHSMPDDMFSVDWLRKAMEQWHEFARRHLEQRQFTQNNKEQRAVSLSAQ